MRRTLAALALAAASVVALTGCVIVPPGFDSFGYVALEPAGGEYDPADEEQWHIDDMRWRQDYGESVAEALRAAGSDVPPAAGEPLGEFRHVALGVGWEWCDITYFDEDAIGSADRHAEEAVALGWTADEFRIAAEIAEAELCGY